MILFPQLLHAYIITGKVVNKNKEAMTGASIVLYKDSTTIAGSTIADETGKFSLTSDAKGETNIKVSMIGSVSSEIKFECFGNNVDLGIIVLSDAPTMLGEVEVVAQNVIEKGSNYIVFPSAKELKQSGTTLDLLEQMQYKLPGLQVNSSLGKVTIENGSAIFQINGRRVDISRIQSLNIDNILRIEYSNVSDIRYGTSVMGVINYITKPVSKGGSIMLNVLGGKGLVNAAFGSTLYYGKSEWTFDYGNSWRDFDKVYNTGTETFIGEQTLINRKFNPTPSSLNYLINKFSIGYTYMHNPTTLFSVSFGGKSNDNKDFTNIFVTQISDQHTSEYKSLSVNHNNNFIPNVDIYFSKRLNKTSKLELNAYGNFISGDIEKALNYQSENIPYSQIGITDNTSWRTGVEALYTKIYQGLETKYGVNYYHNYAENVYVENNGKAQISKQDNNNLYLYGSISGRFNKMTYSAGLGGRYNHTDNRTVSQNIFKFNAKSTINYKLSNKWSLNYLFMFDPTIPSLSQQSNVVQRIDDVSFIAGNPELKTSIYLRNRIFIRYASPKLNVSLWAAHSSNINPIYNRYTYISDKSSLYHGMFMAQSWNANRDDLLNFELQMGYTGTKNLMIYGIAGWDRYTFSSFDNVNPFENFYANINASYAIKNWRFSGRAEIKPRYSLTGNLMKTPERCNVIMAQYRWRDFWFTAGVFNPFGKRGVEYKTKELSTIHPVNSDFYVKNGSNMFTIGVTYRINLGKQFKKAKKGLITMVSIPELIISLKQKLNCNCQGVV